MKLPKIFQKIDFLLILISSISIHFLYFPTHTAGFVTDFTGFAEKMETQPFSNWITCYGFPALEQLRHLILGIFYYAFNVDGIGWYLFFTSFHILNIYLIYRLCCAFFQRYNLPSVQATAFVVATLFAFSPYHAEPLTWRVNFVFLFIPSLFFLSLLLYFKFQSSNKIKDLLILQGFFIFGLFTFELTMALPLVLSALIFFESLGNQTHLTKNNTPITKGETAFFKQWLPVVIPQLSLIGFYFFLQKTVIGKWIGHYGADTHMNFAPDVIFPNILKYSSKYLFFSRHFKQTSKEQIYGFCSQPMVWGTCLFLILALLIFSILKWKNIKPSGRLAWILFACYVLCLLPILNIHFSFTLHIENDRYGYLPSAFFFILIGVFLVKIPLFIRVILIMTYLTFSIYFTKENVRRWAQGDQVYRSLLADFRWENADNVYILSSPDNYEGAGLFRRYRRQDSGVEDALKYIGRREFNANIYEISNFNQHEKSKGFSVQKDSTGLITLQFKNFGSWWWDCGHGTSGYETDNFYFKTRKGRKADFRIHNLGKNDVVIYADVDKWREVK